MDEFHYYADRERGTCQATPGRHSNEFVHDDFQEVIMDEFHYYADRERGAFARPRLFSGRHSGGTVHDDFQEVIKDVNSITMPIGKEAWPGKCLF